MIIILIYCCSPAHMGSGGANKTLIMKKRNFISLSLLLFILWASFAFQACTGNPEIYVSPQGNDTNSGTLDAPFATIQHAIDFIKNNDHDNSVIYLCEGVYDLQHSLILDSLPVNLVIRPYPDEKVTVTGGKRISGFIPVDKKSPFYKKLPKEARNKVLQVNLKALGINRYGNIKPRGFGRPVKPSGLMLYFNGEPMTIARWPNDLWTRTESVPKELDGKGFKYSGERPQRWKDEKDVWMHGYWKWDWADSFEKIKSIDTKKKEIAIADPQGPYPYAKGKRYYVFNVVQELDAPGEWYLDRKSGILFFYPPAEEKDADIYVSLLEEPLISVKNCTGLAIEGITLEYSNGAGVEMTGGSNNIVKDCILRNFGEVAVSIGNLDAGTYIYGNTLYNGNAGTNNGVSNCLISNCGEGGVILGGGDRKTLTPGNNFVENCKISKTSQWVRTYRAGVYMYGAGNIVRHNEIFDMPHTAVFFWGNDHSVEYNNIHHVCMETADAGAVYNGRDWTQRGHMIRYNYIHHLHGVKTKGNFNDVMGVYLDDFSSGTSIYSNIFFKAGRNILIGGGRDNKVKNNIFIDGQPAVHIDARGIGWSRKTFEDDNNNILIKRYKAVNADKPPYSEKYPQLKTVLTDEPAMPKYNCIETNIFCGGKWRELKNHLNDTIVCFKNNVIKDSCDFYKTNNNKIKIDFKNSIFLEGFKEIPVDEIGIMK